MPDPELTEWNPYGPLGADEAPDAIEDALVDLWTIQYGWTDQLRPIAERWVSLARKGKSTQ